jgi:hypothetical protein
LTSLLNYNIKYLQRFLLFFSAFIFLWTDYSNAQPVKKDTVYHSQFDTNKIANPYVLDSKSDTIGYQSYIWSDRKNLSEIVNDKAGYFINYLGIGGRNPISFNNFDESHIGIFRDGVPINENLFGKFDEENVSVSEIEKIEEVSNISSFLYGLNSSGKAINIITKDGFQPTLFSQLRYSQDRYGALFADFSLNVPFSKKFNFIFGINSHFTDGYYQNSDFNVWRGRMKVNFYASPKLNIQAAFNYAKINRRLNGGLVYNTDDTLKNANYAEVYSLGKYERFSNYYFNITANANLFSDKNSLTKFTFYTNNITRLLRNGENGIDPNIDLLHNDYHYIQYGLDFDQHIRKKFSDFVEANLMIGGNAYYNLNNYSLQDFFIYPVDNMQSSYSYNLYAFKTKLDASIYKFLVSGSLKSVYYQKNFWNSYGLEGKYKFIEKNEYKFLLKGGCNATSSPMTLGSYYYEFGFETQYKNLYLDAYQYNWVYMDRREKLFSSLNGNYSLKYLMKYFDLGVNANYSSDTTFPSIYLKSDIVYHNFFFNNKLDLKLGISLKYFSKTDLRSFNMNLYEFTYNRSPGFPIQKNLFNMDFYIGARIGTADINLTVANIFDNLNYTTAIYPYDARGGFLNTISRFSIVWDFNR